MTIPEKKNILFSSLIEYIKFLQKKMRKINFFEVVGSKFIGENKFTLRFWGQEVKFSLFFYKQLNITDFIFCDAPCYNKNQL